MLSFYIELGLSFHTELEPRSKLSKFHTALEPRSKFSYRARAYV